MKCARSTLMGKILKPKLIYYVFDVLPSGNENSILHLFDLETKEKVWLTYHAHYKLILHLLDKMFHHLDKHPSKHNIVKIYLSYHKISSFLLEKQSLVNSSTNISILNRKFCKCLIPSTMHLLETINLDLQIPLVAQKIPLHSNTH